MEEQGLHLLDTFERCLCPGDSLTYQCTVMGEPGGITVWMGSAFNCTSHDIQLFHSDYQSTEGAHGDCGDIVGHSVRTNIHTTNGVNSTAVIHYTSQVTVPINSETMGRIIECIYDDGVAAILVGREEVNITMGIKNITDNK